jgi:hypothetical protein
MVVDRNYTWLWAGQTAVGGLGGDAAVPRPGPYLPSLISALLAGVIVEITDRPNGQNNP